MYYFFRLKLVKKTLDGVRERENGFRENKTDANADSNAKSLGFHYQFNWYFQQALNTVKKTVETISR